MPATVHSENPHSVKSRAYRQRDPEAARQRNQAEAARVRAEVVAGYGGACACCGNAFLPHLTVDHVDGGGTQERQTVDSRSLYRRLRREGSPDTHQVLCWNCNSAKHFCGACRCQEG